MIAAGIASSVDACTFSFSLQGPLLDKLSIIGFPGEFGAWIVNGAILNRGHSVTSATVEFALSLPFNFLVYWIFFRICAFIRWKLLPAKVGGTSHGRSTGKAGSAMR